MVVDLANTLLDPFQATQDSHQVVCPQNRAHLTIDQFYILKERGNLIPAKNSIPHLQHNEIRLGSGQTMNDRPGDWSEVGNVSTRRQSEVMETENLASSIPLHLKRILQT